MKSKAIVTDKESVKNAPDEDVFDEEGVRIVKVYQDECRCRTPEGKWQGRLTKCTCWASMGWKFYVDKDREYYCEKSGIITRSWDINRPRMIELFGEEELREKNDLWLTKPHYTWVSDSKQETQKREKGE